MHLTMLTDRCSNVLRAGRLQSDRISEQHPSYLRHNRTNRASGYEAKGDGDIVGRRRKSLLPGRSEGRLCGSTRRHVIPFRTLWLQADFDADNHMINGTKLLNVAGMTRGRRDGILKSEKTRHVVKIGPMHLKGVW